MMAATGLWGPLIIVVMAAGLALGIIAVVRVIQSRRGRANRAAITWWALATLAMIGFGLTIAFVAELIGRSQVEQVLATVAAADRQQALQTAYAIAHYPVVIALIAGALPAALGLTALARALTMRSAAASPDEAA